MASVVGYWQLPEDEREFLEYLESTGQIVAFPPEGVLTAAEVQPESIRSFIESRDPSGLEFGPMELQEVPVPMQIGEERRFMVTAMRHCVIGYRRGRLYDGTITQSNLCAYSSYLADDCSHMVSKRPEFLSWSKKVLRWVRKRTTDKVECNGYSYRATRRVKAAVTAGELRAKLY